MIEEVVCQVTKADGTSERQTTKKRMCWDFGVASDGTKNTEFRPIENLVNKGDEHEDLFFDKNDSDLKKYATEKKD